MVNRPIPAPGSNKAKDVTRYFSRLALLGLFSLGSSLSLAQPPAADNQPLPLESLRLFAEALERIKQNYVNEVSDEQLLEYAIQGMVANLDPHSSYLPPREFRELQESTSGEFGGLGIEVDQQDGFIRVVAPIDDTPAQRAGIQSGDHIIKIDGNSVSSLGLDEAINMMRGKPGSKVTLTLMREGQPKPLELTLERAIIQVKSVKPKVYEQEYAYLRITQFQDDTGTEVQRALSKMQKEQRLKGVVLDLRNNPGGVLQAAVDVADAFLPPGLVVYTQGRDKQDRIDFEATQADLSNNLPLVVLINGGSASASEIVAGALQDRKRAVLLGEPSFGKGSVQSIMPLGAEGALKITTALYFTPNGRSIQAEGIEPDIPVANASVTRLENSGPSIREADLRGHLGNGGGNTHKAGESIQTLMESDYQLFEAFNLLKALSLVKGN
ncbi:S41 family peptidase [Balneatrix alpica]|uniref:S41 family peptidase n=1 Tax=Balneatrix alpica TaxID=75684 RepID=A0ABV5ZDI5_9GAMM|nr:S41 family peptidase [Balneatrix alpica]